MAKEIIPPLPRLRSFLRSQRAYLAIYERYQRTIPKTKTNVHALLETLITDAHDQIAQISRAIRTLNGTVQDVEPHPKLIQQGFTRRSTVGKLQFVYVGLDRLLEFLEDQQELPDPPEIAELWQECYASQKARREQLRQLIADLTG